MDVDSGSHTSNENGSPAASEANNTFVTTATAVACLPSPPRPPTWTLSSSSGTSKHVEEEPLSAGVVAVVTAAAAVAVMDDDVLASTVVAQQADACCTISTVEAAVVDVIMDPTDNMIASMSYHNDEPLSSSSATHAAVAVAAAAAIAPPTMPTAVAVPIVVAPPPPPTHVEAAVVQHAAAARSDNEARGGGVMAALGRMVHAAAAAAAATAIPIIRHDGKNMNRHPLLSSWIVLLSSALVVALVAVVVASSSSMTWNHMYTGHATNETTTASHWLIRIVLLRSLAFVYAVSFVVAYNQNKALIGDRGITPARQVLDRATRRRNNSRPYSSFPRKKEQPAGKMAMAMGWLRDELFLWDKRNARTNHVVTTLLWLAPNRAHLDPWLDSLALAGLTCSSIILVVGASNLPLLLVPWICHRSLWAVGGEWYAYGWESILSELGFYSLFLVPVWEISKWSTPVPVLVLWPIRWLLFRIILGAGLVKLRGSPRWKDLSAMNFFYETQPVPNRLSRYFHWAPKQWHQLEVVVNHFVELVAPVLLLLPGDGLYIRTARQVGGLIQMTFQMTLLLAGNFCYLNWLTAIPALACLDDEHVRFLFSFESSSNSTLHSWEQVRAAISSGSMVEDADGAATIIIMRQSVSLGLAIAVAWLSLPAIRNLFTQEMVIGSFDPYQLVNVFGAFGHVSEERIELIVSSSMDGNIWKEYEFPVKPGSVYRSPRWLLSPYHYRLDWQLWIAAQFQTVSASSPWIYPLLVKLLEAEPEVLRSLVAHDPWHGQRPKYIKIDKYRYRFCSRAADGKNGNAYWTREFVEPYFPVHGEKKGASLESLYRRIDMFG